MTRVLPFALLVCLAVAVHASAAPSILVDSDFHSTAIQTASLVTHTFTLSNVGDEALEITDVIPSCSCTTASLDALSIQPGQSAGLHVEIDTTGFVGLVIREIAVYSNDPATPVLFLTVDVDAPIAATPRKLAQDAFLASFYVLIDVRTPEEFDAGHLLGSVNIPLSELQTNLGAWTPHLPMDVPLVVYCKGGFRSAIGAQILFDAGFENAVDLLDGMDTWVAAYGDAYLFDTFDRSGAIAEQEAASEG